MILEALDRAGGVDYLRRQAVENPPAFLALVGKVLPKDVRDEPKHRENLSIQVSSRSDGARGGKARGQ